MSLSPIQPTLQVSICFTRPFPYRHPSPPEDGPDPIWVQEWAGGQPAPAARHPRSPLLQTAPAVGQQVSESSLSPRPQERAEGARDSQHNPTSRDSVQHRGGFPAGRAWRGLAAPLQPSASPAALTSVSMGSTSIPFHSSSKWAIGMLPDGCEKPG